MTGLVAGEASVTGIVTAPALSANVLVEALKRTVFVSVPSSSLMKKVALGSCTPFLLRPIGIDLPELALGRHHSLAQRKFFRLESQPILFKLLKLLDPQ